MGDRARATSAGTTLSLDQLRTAVRLTLGRVASEDSSALPADGPLRELLIANRLGPLLARALRRRGPSLILPTVLTEDARAAATSALSAVAPLRDVERAFERERIQWMLWKGPALAVQAWGDVAARHFIDLDLVVAPADRSRAVGALVGAGWRTRHGMSLSQQRAVLGGSGAFEFERDANEPFIELHWRFASARFPRLRGVSEVMARAEAVEVGGVRVLTPSGADALLLLAMHATKHGWSRAEEVATFARLAERFPNAVPERASDLGGELSVRLGLALCDLLADAERAPTLSGGAEDAAMGVTVATCLTRMQRGDAGWRPDHAWTLRWIVRRRDRVRYRLHALFAPTLEEWKHIRLPGALAWGYPAVRLMRLVTRRR